MFRSCFDCLIAEKHVLSSHVLLSIAMLQRFYDHLMHGVLTYHDHSPCRFMT